jgi:hypothetical protein
VPVLVDEFDLNIMLLIGLLPGNCDHDPDPDVDHIRRIRTWLNEPSIDAASGYVQQVVHGFGMVAQDGVYIHGSTSRSDSCELDGMTVPSDANEAHLAQHNITATDVTQVWWNGPIFVPNKKGLTAAWLMLGDTNGNRAYNRRNNDRDCAPVAIYYGMEQHDLGVDEVEAKKGRIEAVAEEELGTQIEAMRDDTQAWGDPVREPRSRRKSERRQRGAMVSVRFSPDELELVQAQAAGVGASVSGYLRNLALTAAQQPVVTMTWVGIAAANLPRTEERLLVRSGPLRFPWLPGSGLVGDI